VGDETRAVRVVHHIADIALRPKVAELHSEHRRRQDAQPDAILGAQVGGGSQRLVVLDGSALQRERQLALGARGERQQEERGGGRQDLLHRRSPISGRATVARTVRGDKNGRLGAAAWPAWRKAGQRRAPRGQGSGWARSSSSCRRTWPGTCAGVTPGSSGARSPRRRRGWSREPSWTSPSAAGSWRGATMMRIRTSP